MFSEHVLLEATRRTEAVTRIPYTRRWDFSVRKPRSARRLDIGDFKTILISHLSRRRSAFGKGSASRQTRRNLLAGSASQPVPPPRGSERKLFNFRGKKTALPLQPIDDPFPPAADNASSSKEHLSPPGRFIKGLSRETETIIQVQQVVAPSTGAGVQKRPGKLGPVGIWGCYYATLRKPSPSSLSLFLSRG